MKVKKKERKEEKPTRIVYQFLYNNNSRQLTEVQFISLLLSISFFLSLSFCLLVSLSLSLSLCLSPCLSVSLLGSLSLYLFISFLSNFVSFLGLRGLALSLVWTELSSSGLSTQTSQALPPKIPFHICGNYFEYSYNLDIDLYIEPEHVHHVNIELDHVDL